MSNQDFKKLTKEELIQEVESLNSRNQALKKLILENESGKLQEKLNLTVESVNLGLWDWNLQSGFQIVNSQWAEMLGFNLDEIEQNISAWERLVHPDDKQKSLTIFADYLAGKTPSFESVHRMKTKSGEWKWILSKGRIIEWDTDGKPVRALGIHFDMTDQKKAEDALRESEERLRLALMAAKLGTWNWDILQNKITWSENVHAIFGVSSESFNGTFEEYEKLIILEDKPKVINAIEASLTTGIEYFIQHRILTSDSNIRWLEGKGSVYKNSEGLPIRMVGTVVDITERRLAEEYLKASEKRFECFYEFTSEAIIIIDANDQRIIDINLAFENLFEYTRVEVIGISIDRLMLDDSWEKVRESLKNEADNYRIEITARKKTKSIFPAFLKLHFYSDKRIEKIAICILDISTMKEAEKLKIINKEIILQNEMIEKQKIELETVIENLRRMQAKLIQSEKMASLGQLISGVAHEINNPIGAIQASSQNLEDCLDESRNLFLKIMKIVNEIGENKTRIFLNLIYDGAKNSKQLIGLEQRKRKKEIAAQLEELNLSDDIQDMLADIGIINLEPYRDILTNQHCKILLDYASQQIFSMRSIKTIQVAVERSSKILFALKNFAHFDTKTEKTICKIADNIETVLTIYSNNLKSIEIIKDYETVRDIHCYPDDLLHLWTNLIYNALQAMKFQGVLKIEIREEEQFLLVAITDSGEGISPEIQEKIFEPFFTTKAQGEGSGLGLDIVKKIVDKHRGKIKLSSKKGETTFTVYLPV